MTQEQLEKQKIERESHAKQLAEKYGVAGHKNESELYRLAYDYGHSSGWSEIEIYYQDLVVLLK